MSEKKQTTKSEPTKEKDSVKVSKNPSANFGTGKSKSSLKRSNKVAEIKVPSLEEALAAHKSNVTSPSLEELFEAGAHFGHETKRWNPKMEQFIYESRGPVHIFDLEKTKALLDKAINFLSYISKQGYVIFVGTKRQASPIVYEEAIRSGSYFVNSRWAGGLLTNFKTIKKSLKRLTDIEKGFEEGVEGRTKFEISQMKKEWQRLSRLYSGVKGMNNLPVAAVVVDAKYEIGAIKECRTLGIPVVSLVDSNTNPDDIDYVIPCNDDALKSIRLILKTLADAVREGNKGKELVHNLKDYSKVEVEIIKNDGLEDESGMEQLNEDSKDVPSTKESAKKSRSSAGRGKSQGILEKMQQEKEGK